MEATRELAKPLVEYVTRLGFTHVEFLPVAEHAYYPSWGYQVTGFLRADQPLRHAGGFSISRQCAARGRHRRDRGLGARAFSA